MLGCSHGCVEEAGELEVSGRRALQRRAEAAHRDSLQRAERVRVRAPAGPDLLAWGPQGSGGRGRMGT